MSADTRPRAYPILSRALIAVGAFFLCLAAIGNWRFGWSLAHEFIDRLWLATVYAGSDVAAGVMVCAGAAMLLHVGWRWKLGGIVATMPAVVLVVLSILSTFGMMSGRIAVSAGQRQAIQVDKDRLSWLRGQTLNREIPKGERRMFRLEERNAAQEARKQASIVTDNQAVALSNAADLVGLKLSEEQAQVGLTFASSSMPMMIKFVCLWLGFLLFGMRRDVQRETQANSTHSGGNSGGSSGSGSGGKDKLSGENVRPLRPGPVSIKAAPVSTDNSKGKLTFQQFKHHIEQDMLHGELASSTRALAAATGWSQTSVVKQARKVKQRQLFKPMRRGNGGGGYVVSASG